MPLNKVLAIVIVVFILFKVYFSTLVYANMTMGYLLWLCNLIWLVLALGIYTKNKSVITIALVHSMLQISWYIEFFQILFGMTENLTLLEYLVKDETDLMINIDNAMSFIVHIFLIPSCFYATKKYGFDNKALKPVLIFSSSLLLISFIASLIFPEFHINCVSSESNCGIVSVDDKVGYFLVSSLFSLLYLTIVFFLLKALFFSQLLIEYYKTGLK